MDWKEIIFKAVIMILGALLTGVIIPWIKTKISNETLMKIKAWAKIGVEAAEMLFPESGSGEQKKEYVLAFLTNVLAKIGVSLTAEELNNIIESAVKELHLKEV